MIYVAATLILFFFGVHKKQSKYRDNLYWVTIAVFFSIAAFRYETGTDWVGYRDQYLYLTEIKYGYPEIGYQLLIFICKYIGLDFPGFIIVTSLPAIAMAVFLNRWGKEGRYAPLLFFAFGYIVFLGGIRQSIAITIIAGMILTRNNRRHLLLIPLFTALAWSFHYSSLFACVIYCLTFYAWSKKGLIILIFSSVLIGIIGGSYFDILFSVFNFPYSKNDAVGLSDNSQIRDMVLYAEWLSVSLLIVSIFNKSYGSMDGEIKLHMTLCIFAACIYFIFWQHSRMTAGRLPLYFRYSEAVVLSVVLNRMVMEKGVKILLHLLILIASSVRVFATFVYLNPFYTPYTCVFFYNEKTQTVIDREAGADTTQ